MLWQIALAILVCYVLWKVLKTGENELNRVPGPPKWPIIGSALSFLGLSQSEMFDKLLELRLKYGNRFVIKVLNRYILHVYNVEDIETVLTHSRNIKKSKPYMFIEPWLGTGLLVSTGAKWNKRRKILTPTFHFDILQSFMEVFEEQSRNLVKELKKQISEGSDVVDVSPLISDFTLYTICETAMGVRLDSDKTEAKLKYKDAILEIGNLVMERLVTIWLHNDFIFSLHPLGKKFAKCLENVHSFADSVIKERSMSYESRGEDDNEKTNGRRRALLDLLLEARIRNEIDLEGIREEVNTFMFEGHDTTATALTFGLMLLADHPDVQESIFDECKAILGDSDRSPSASELNEMKYLDAVIKEILRLYPSVPFIGREIVEDFMLGDTKVAKGNEVIVHIFYMQQREDLYPEPKAFKPERFLNGEKRHPFSYVPFSAGPRNCIGQRFAKMEMKSVISEIIRNFKLEPTQKGARPTLKADLVLRTTEPIYVKFVKR
ncbi:cytochrome P450 4C1-like [Vanessa atalanta]|uniref:cytochrome P450 4C1-like n=1 Tax=Vanessa atalanta TaxID=42275 RepID=UPI001FCE1709|nr:cytochrome P450 4C1-like [Vanessa atalanta]XP_047532281.1 cytochrome P450 4C1-like [Vanessa atalanta]